MMTRSSLALSALLGCLAILPAGCGSTSESSGASEAEDSVKAIMAGMEEGRPVVVWEALPETYQADINEVVQAFGTNMDADAWGQITGLVSNIHQTLATKQEFLLNTPMILNAEDPATAQATVKQSTQLLKSFLESVQDLEKLKTFDGAEFMQSSGKQMAQQMMAIQKVLESNPAIKAQMTLSNAKVETVESTSTTAKLKLTDPDGKGDQLVEMVLVDGKWLPKPMVDGWDANMAKAREAIKELPAKAAEMKMKMMMVSGVANGMLSPLQAAENQEQFDKAIAGLQSGALGILGSMGGMGGPAATPPGGGGSNFGDPSGAGSGQ